MNRTARGWLAAAFWFFVFAGCVAIVVLAIIGAITVVTS